MQLKHRKALLFVLMLLKQFSLNFTLTYNTVIAVIYTPCFSKIG